MDTAAYEKLLRELEIPSERSAEYKESALDEKYSEALELLDVAQQNGEENRITQLEDRIRKIENALEYTREIKKQLSSGLVINTQSDKDRLEELKEMGKKEAIQTVKRLENTSQPAANTPAPQPPVSSNNANSLLQSQMRRARMELEDENWSQATRLYNDILNAEPANAEANLGLFMATQKIRERKYIPEAARDAMKNNRDIFQDKQFLLTRRYADDSLKKELESYEKGRDYLIAMEEWQRAKTNEDYQNVSEMLGKLGDYEDAPKKKEECDKYWKKQLYDVTMQAMKSAVNKDEFAAIINNFDKLGGYEDAREQRKQAIYLGAVRFLRNAKDTKDVSDFSAAKKMFEELGDYSDSKEKIKECDEGIEELPKLLQRQLESYGKYKQEYKNFEERLTDRKEIIQYESKIRSQQARIDSLEKKAARKPLQKRWIFLTGGIGLLFCFAPVAVSWMYSQLIGYWLVGFPYILLNLFSPTLQTLITVIIFGGWFYYFLKIKHNRLAPACIKSLVSGVITCIIIGLITYAFEYTLETSENFDKLSPIIGAVVLVISMAMIGMRIIGKSGTKEIERLKRRVDDDYENIEKMIGMEYQKIYDRYPEAGSERKEVSEVQKILMDNIKKRHGAG